MNDTKELFVCACGDPEHQFIVSQFPNEAEVYIFIHLDNLTFWQRLKYAVMYIFGKKSKYGAFGEIILNKEEKNRLISVLKDE
jgi:hypothetical protein